MFSSHLKSWEMMVPRRWKDLTVFTQDDGGWWGGVPPEVYNHLHCFNNIELQVVASAPGPQKAPREFVYHSFIRFSTQFLKNRKTICYFQYSFSITKAKKQIIFRWAGVSDGGGGLRGYYSGRYQDHSVNVYTHVM